MTSPVTHNPPYGQINEIGISEIQLFLAERHKFGGDHFTPDMLRGWAEQAEFHLNDGNPASIEIPSWHSVSGHPEIIATMELHHDY